MILDLSDYCEKTAPISNVCFKFYQGSGRDLKEPVDSADKDWMQYFNENTTAFCEYIGEKAVSFCIVDLYMDCILQDDGSRIGGVGCVGTVPEFRHQGIGLRMVDLVTLYLKNNGCDRSYIHYTHIDKWYAKLGYETIARFSFN